MDKLHEFFVKKLGGLPVWAWGLIAVAGVGAGYLVIRYQQKSTAQSAAISSTATDPGSSVQNALSQPSVGMTDSTLVPYTGGSTNSQNQNYFPETQVNGQWVPVIPAGYQAIYDSNGVIVGYEPIPPTGTSTLPVAGVPGGTVPPGSTVYKTKASGSLESTPHDTKGGKNLLTVPSGVSVTYVSGPIPDPLGGSKKYYQVTYNGKTGYIGSDVLDLTTRQALAGSGPEARRNR